MSELTKEYFDQNLVDLKKSISEGFANVDKKFETVGNKFNAIDEQFESLALSIKKGFDEVDEKFEKVDERFDSVEKQLTVVQNKLDQALYHDLEIHERWIKQLADKVGIVLQV